MAMVVNSSRLQELDQKETKKSYTSCGRLRSILGRGDMMTWLVVEAGSDKDCTPVDKDPPSTTYAD